MPRNPAVAAPATELIPIANPAAAIEPVASSVLKKMASATMP